MRAHTCNREGEAVMLSSDIYLSNPISSNPYLPSQAPMLLQQQLVLVHLSERSMPRQNGEARGGKCRDG